MKLPRFPIPGSSPGQAQSGMTTFVVFMSKDYYVYILASKKNGVLYIGITNDLIRRIYEHKNNIKKGFTTKYKIYKLMYYEEFDDIGNALYREKQLKKWNRQWKIDLIEENNSEWRDLYKEIIQ